MRKIFLLTTPLTVLIALGAALLIFNRNQPPVWQDKLDRYLLFKNASTSVNYEVQSVVKASQPWNFNPDMSKAAFGESAYYQTDYRYGEEPPDRDTLALIPGRPPSGALMPLPYPPKQVWCVLVESNKNSENSLPGKWASRWVLVALHQDLYNADMIIHEVAEGSQDQINDEIIAALGCEFP